MPDCLHASMRACLHACAVHDPSAPAMLIHMVPFVRNAGANAHDRDLRLDVEQARVSALECLTSLLINAAVCRKAVPCNRSMLFRVASAITSSQSIALLSAAAQVRGGWARPATPGAALGVCRRCVVLIRWRGGVWEGGGGECCAAGARPRHRHTIIGIWIRPAESMGKAGCQQHNARQAAKHTATHGWLPNTRGMRAVRRREGLLPGRAQATSPTTHGSMLRPRPSHALPTCAAYPLPPLM
eukprot:286944-Chlamydomonas_euryale.AAC.3